MRKITMVLLPLAVAALMFGGCFRHNYLLGGVAYPEPAFQDNLHHHIFYGLANVEGDIDISATCPNGVALVHNKIHFVGALLGMLTANIWTPTQVKVYCAQAGAELEGADVAIVE